MLTCALNLARVFDSVGMCCCRCRDVWWIDPVGAILISCYIVWAWIGIASEQMDLMVRRLLHH